MRIFTGTPPAYLLERALSLLLIEGQNRRLARRRHFAYARVPSFHQNPDTAHLSCETTLPQKPRPFLISAQFIGFFFRSSQNQARRQR